ncbi:MAG: hypothetical protein NUV32_10665 [Exilispira sp.]|nr:hypothetical protein [Exilispira sp.]
MSGYSPNVAAPAGLLPSSIMTFPIIAINSSSLSCVISKNNSSSLVAAGAFS